MLAHCYRCGDDVPMPTGRAWRRQQGRDQRTLCEACIDELADTARDSLKRLERDLDEGPRRDLGDVIR